MMGKYLVHQTNENITMSIPNVIIAQDKLAAKIAKLEATRIIQAEHKKNKGVYAKLHALNSEKATCEYHITEKKLVHFEVLNTPKREL